MPTIIYGIRPFDSRSVQEIHNHDKLYHRCQFPILFIEIFIAHIKESLNNVIKLCWCMLEISL